MTPEEKKSILEKIHRLQKDTFAEYCGIQYGFDDKDEIVVSVEVKPCHLNPGNSVHGGMLFTLIDNTAGFAARINRQFSGRVVTQTASVHYLRPAVSGLLRAKAKPIHEGRQTSLYHVDILNDREQVVCCGEATMFYLPEGTEKG